MSGNKSHYDVLGVPVNADQSAIRKAYLRASLRCHPDKNPGREEEAKTEFIQVGQAYEVLGDATKRAAHDRELKGGTRPTWRPAAQQRPQQTYAQQQSRPQKTYAQTSPPPSSGQKQYKTQQTDEKDEDDFAHFMNMFDETVSGMSEEELSMAMGAAAVVGGIIGSIMGARAARNGNSFLSSAASMVGSAMASRAASQLVQTVHEDSKQRALEKEERAAAIARGETVREPTSRESKERVFQDAARGFQKVAGASVGGGVNNVGGRRSINYSFSAGNKNGNSADRFRNGNSFSQRGRAGQQQRQQQGQQQQQTQERGQFSWGDAAKLPCGSWRLCRAESVWGEF